MFDVLSVPVRHLLRLVLLMHMVGVLIAHSVLLDYLGKVVV